MRFEVLEPIRHGTRAWPDAPVPNRLFRELDYVVLKMSGDGPQLLRQVKTQLPSVRIFSIKELPELCGPNATPNGAHSRGRLTGYPVEEP